MNVRVLNAIKGVLVVLKLVAMGQNPV